MAKKKPSPDGGNSQKQTGPCPVCGLELRGHRVCSICGILVGANHQESEYADPRQARGYERVCQWCVEMWDTKERVAGRRLGLKEVGQPLPIAAATPLSVTPARRVSLKAAR